MTLDQALAMISFIASVIGLAVTLVCVSHINDDDDYDDKN